jgi:hypothetical protein
LLFTILKIKNTRQEYQDSVENLCSLLADKKGQGYRSEVFGLLMLTGSRYLKQINKYGFDSLKETFEARQFKRCFPADVIALNILNELDTLYNSDNQNIIDDRRGAVLEVFSYLVCKKLFSIADKEVKIKIGDWISEKSIDSAGCSKNRGCCFQGKATSNWQAESIIAQGTELNHIANVTANKATCGFLTFQSEDAFYQVLASKGLNKNDYIVFGRYQMEHFESVCMPPKAA